MSATSKDATYSDDEDEIELPMTSWGSQTPNQTQAKEQSTRDQIADWKSLIDPNAKITSGLGSGNLHRQGRNYKPVDEDYILAQRKKQPLPKKTSKPKTEKKKVRFDTNTNSSTTSKWDAPSKFSRAKPSKKDPTLSAATAAAPPAPSPSPARPSTARVPQKSVWATAALVEEPFWEKDTQSQVKSSIDPPPQPQPPRFSRPKNKTKRHEDQCDPWAPPPRADNNKKNNKDEHKAPRVEPKPRTASGGWDPSQEAATQERDADSWKGWTSTEPHFDGWDIAPEVEAEAAAAANSAPSQNEGWASSNNWNMEAASSGGWGSPATNNASMPGRSNTSSERSTASPSAATTASASSNTSQSSSSSASSSKTNRQFSDAGRRKYSKPIGSGPLPNNYNPNIPVAPPKRVARMPAGENPVILTVNVRLEEDNNIPIDIRYHDDADYLARQFCMKHHIKSNATFTALRQLLADEKKQELQYQNMLKRQTELHATRPFDRTQQSHRHYQHQQTSRYHHQAPFPGPPPAHHTTGTRPVNFT
ncbi:hypothetical protein BCR43DRAFT_512470 [Syncephalastrum racemosum]|uniref:Uncharacterized protein n=1 Tax=Syncephalastrum racemosum TaxID=13706 RepID=A0A1X2HQE4_SYNRA|nr:hypothetical protein BCR43DRAFT_512470 [Syncephalastrum racemosum]